MKLFCKVIVYGYENSFEFKIFWPHCVTPVLLFLHAKQGKNVNHGHKNGLSCLKAKAYSNQTNQYITLCDLTIAFTTSITLVFLVAWKKLRGGVLCCATNLTKVWGCQGWVWLIFNNAGYANFVFVQILNYLNIYFFQNLLFHLKSLLFLNTKWCPR